jgi:hypothetical protein
VQARRLLLHRQDALHFQRLERKPPYLFLIRPRRFGKSLLVSMLETYYDSLLI